jgi:hypothetical protein
MIDDGDVPSNQCNMVVREPKSMRIGLNSFVSVPVYSLGADPTENTAYNSSSIGYVTVAASLSHIVIVVKFETM